MTVHFKFVVGYMMANKTFAYKHNIISFIIAFCIYLFADTHQACKLTEYEWLMFSEMLTNFSRK